MVPRKVREQVLDPTQICDVLGKMRLSFFIMQEFSCL
jgi:hypothetical protein